MNKKLDEYLREADKLAAKAKEPKPSSLGGSIFESPHPDVVALANAVELLAHAIRELNSARAWRS